MVIVKIKHRTDSDHNDLVKRVLNGDNRSATILYDLLIPVVKSVIRNKIFKISIYETELLAHDIVSTIFEKLHLYHNSSTILPWATRIAHNNIIDRYRSYKETVSLHEHNSEYDIEIAINQNTPESLLILKEKSIRINKALSALPRAKRNLILSYADGKSMKELSIENNKSISATNSEVFRIKSEIKQLLEQGEK